MKKYNYSNLHRTLRSMKQMIPVASGYRTAFLDAALLGLVLAAGSSAAEGAELDKHPGKAVYQKLCIECHGRGGEAVEGKTDNPLQGNRDIASLAQRIEKTMPEGTEDECVGKDAKAVAEYIYHAFYSVEARARNTPARVEVTRLTVPQYRNSVADLVLGFRGDLWIGEERGLKANYYGGYKFNEREEFRNQKKKDRFETRDSQIRFDFGERVPQQEEAKEFAADGFSIRWDGSLLPEATGVYEFIIRTRNGVTLWVNENDHSDGKKTIDGWVAPDNNVREQKGNVFLIGGRPVPIRVDFFKYKEKASSIELLWKPPHGVLQTIPQRNLSPDYAQESLIVSAPFPADDRSVGYERGTSVSKAWFEAVTIGATEAAGYVVEHLDRLARTKSGQPDRERKIREFGLQFVERAFRRPLTEEERKRFVDQQFEQAATPEQALKRLVLFSLTSPRFLYPGFRGDAAPDKWEIASRLALSLWDSLPNQRLREATRKGQLDKPEQVARMAGQMVWDWRSRAKIRGFFHRWLELERAVDLSKDKDVYPEFDDVVLADLRTSLNLFLDEAVWGEDANYRQLLLADYLFLNERLGKLYGKNDIQGGFQKVTLDPDRRSGIVTHPFLLSTLAYHNNTSPIYRGVFLTRNVVGMTLKSPPMANEFKEGKFDPTLTMREKVTEMTRAKACMGCHVTINPLGFSLEHYDGIGRWRTKDQNKPIDSTSDFKTEAGKTIKLTGARDVAEFAANTPSAHRAFIQQLFHHTVKQPVLAYGEGKMEELRNGFQESNYSVPELLKRIALTAALQGTKGNEP